MSNVQRTMEAAVMIITVMSSKKHFGVDDCRGSDCRTPGLGADIGPDIAFDPTAFVAISFGPFRLIPILLIRVLGI